MNPVRRRGTTTIELHLETREKLKAIGKKGESYDAIINRLLRSVAKEDKDTRGQQGGGES